MAGLGERLATWNLGLVRVADPASFAWPGHWIAVLEASGGARRAVVFFGVPSGPLEERDAAIARGANIVEGYLIAPLDLAAPHGLERVRPPGAKRRRRRSVHGAGAKRPRATSTSGAWFGRARHAGRPVRGGGRDVLAPRAARAGPDPDRGGGLRRALRPRYRPRPGRCAPQRRHPRYRPQRPGRAPLHHRRRPLLRLAARRAMRASRASDHARRVARPRPSRRHPRRRARRRRAAASATRSGPKLDDRSER